MQVADLQSFLKSLSGPLGAAGGKKVADELDRAAGGLEPFRDLTIAQFADFLMRADEYARTGVIPTKGKPARRSASTVDRAKVQGLAQEVLGLYERAVDESVEYSAIEAEVARWGKKLNKNEAVELAREVGLNGPIKTKKAALEEVRRKIVERKESFQRTQF